MSAADTAHALAIDRTRPAIAVVTINRARQRNAGNLAVWTGVRDAFPALAAEGVRLAIVAGAGGHFCAGNDIKAFAAIRHDPGAEQAWMDAIKAAYAAIQAAPFPVVAAIDGSCVGAGCGLAMSCDFRVATNGARFAIPAARLGILYPAEQTRRLASLIGIGNARRWLYGGALQDAAAAMQDGFVDALVDADPIAAAIEFAQPFLDNAPLSVAGAKRQLNALADGRFEQEAAALAQLYREAEASADHAEAERAFAAKRAPRFTGR
jgi:enoyl-CoA hydratase